MRFGSALFLLIVAWLVLQVAGVFADPGGRLATCRRSANHAYMNKSWAFDTIREAVFKEDITLCMRAAGYEYDTTLHRCDNRPSTIGHVVDLTEDQPGCYRRVAWFGHLGPGN